jgi:hypothetical protein
MRTPISEAAKPAAGAAVRILHNYVPLEGLARIPASVSGRDFGTAAFLAGNSGMAGGGQQDCAAVRGEEPQQETRRGLQRPVILKDRKLRAAWRAWLIDKGTRQALEPPSETAERVRGYYQRQFRRAIECGDSGLLAETLIELEELVLEEARIYRWQLPRLQEALSRLTEPL